MLEMDWYLESLGRARYVVLVTKHHDGYCLWPTDVPNPHRPGFHSRRDVVGELADAVRSRGLRFGVYYSGGLDWTFNDHPIGTFSDLLAAQPRGDYVEYAEAHVRELIDRYQPSVLWNDISWPAPTKRLAGLLTEYYDAVPDGVVNDRFMPWSPAWQIASSKPGRALLDQAAARSAAAEKGIVPPKPPLFDVRTPEYTVFETVQPTPWECVRGIDRSFGHNRESDESHFLSRRDLLWSLTDIAAKGGNLLLNVGPRGEDAAIADTQLRRLDWLAEFTGPAAEALFATRPWVHPQGTASGRIDLRYTARDTTVYAFLRASGDQPVDAGACTLAEVRATRAPRSAPSTVSCCRRSTRPRGSPSRSRRRSIPSGPPCSRSTTWTRADRRRSRPSGARLAQQAELVALRVREHDPRLLPLADVDRCGTEREPAGELGVLVGPRRRAHVEVQAVLGRLGLGHGDDEERGPRPVGVGQLDLAVVLPAPRALPPEDLLPEVRHRSHVVGVEDQFTQHERHGPECRAPLLGVVASAAFGPDSGYGA
jgi:alpha-L-fucosidase